MNNLAKTIATMAILAAMVGTLRTWLTSLQIFLVAPSFTSPRTIRQNII